MSGIGHNRPPAIFEMEGWIAVHRSQETHHLVGFGKQVKPCDPSRGFCYSRAEAWQHLIFRCRFNGTTIINGGKEMRLERGQVLGAVSFLAHCWNWTPKTVRNWLSQLSASGMLTLAKPGKQHGRQKGKQATIITVCNYDKYQTIGGWDGQAIGQDAGHAKGTQRASKGQARGNTRTREQWNKDLEPNGSCADDSAPLPLQLSQEPEPKKRRKPAIDGTVIVSAFNAYNDMALECSLQQASKLTPGRRTQIGARLKEHGPDGWAKVLDMIRQSRFLRGQTDGRNGPFGLNLDWLMKRANFDKVIDGNYGNGAGAPKYVKTGPNANLEEYGEKLTQAWREREAERLRGKS